MRAQAFEEWLLLKREQFHLQMLALLHTLADQHLAAGHATHAAEAARRQKRSDGNRDRFVEVGVDQQQTLSRTGAGAAKQQGRGRRARRRQGANGPKSTPDRLGRAPCRRFAPAVVAAARRLERNG